MIDIENLKEEYFLFLFSLIMGDFSAKYHKNFDCLRFLHNIEFYSIIPMDNNRINDGKFIRKRFGEYKNFNNIISYLSEPASVLEVLLGLAYRMEWQLANLSNQKSVKECFNLFLDNLNLSYILKKNKKIKKEDINDYFIWCYEDIRNKISCFLDRKYDKNGKGGIFPLEIPKYDQRKRELWYQMADYLHENFKF